MLTTFAYNLHIYAIVREPGSDLFPYCTSSGPTLQIKLNSFSIILPLSLMSHKVRDLQSYIILLFFANLRGLRNYPF